jgi:hypothetical protein
MLVSLRKAMPRTVKVYVVAEKVGKVVAFTEYDDDVSFARAALSAHGLSQTANVTWLRPSNERPADSEATGAWLVISDRAVAGGLLAYLDSGDVEVLPAPLQEDDAHGTVVMLRMDVLNGSGQPQQQQAPSSTSKGSKGKQKRQQWQGDLHDLARDNCIRYADGTYVMRSDKPDDSSKF